jgi:single-strand DNA-binding protein
MAGKSLNRVELLGNVGKEIEVKYTPSGTAVAKFSLATNSSFKDKSGEWQQKTEWHNITCWARLAEIASEYLHKGDKVYIEGRLETSSWDDKQSGTKKYMTSIIVQDLILLGNKQPGDGSAGDGRDRGFDQSRSAGGTAVTESNPITDDDIPF